MQKAVAASERCDQSPPKRATTASRERAGARNRGRRSRRRGALLFARRRSGATPRSCLPGGPSVLLSFTSWNGIAPSRPSVGLANYRELLHDTDLPPALKNTALWTIVRSRCRWCSGSRWRWGSTRRSPGARAPHRSLYCARRAAAGRRGDHLGLAVTSPTAPSTRPSATSVSARSRAPGSATDSTALWATMVAGIWVGTGFPMLIYLAALQGVPRELYDSARSRRRRTAGAASATSPCRHCATRTTSCSRSG